MNNFIATKNDEGRTLLKYISRLLSDVPTSKIERMFREKDIKLNGARTKDKKYLVKEGDEITLYGVRFSFEKHENIKFNFKTIFEDENILVVSKPANISIHDEDDSLDNQVLSYLEFEKIDSFTPSHIGRIDKATTGVVLYGKTYEALRELKENVGKFEKYYRLKSYLDKSQTFEGLIHHNELEKKEIISLKFGKETKTIFTVLEDDEVEAQIITGRKHQIRSSLAFLGFPIIGDLKYGGERSDRIYLHSHRIVLKGLSGNLEYLNNQEFIAKNYFE